jgi:hypothetical protein
VEVCWELQTVALKGRDTVAGEAQAEVLCLAALCQAGHCSTLGHLSLETAAQSRPMASDGESVQQRMDC